MVRAAPRCGSTSCHCVLPHNTVKMKNFMFCVFFPHKKLSCYYQFLLARKSFFFIMPLGNFIIF